MTQCLKAEWSWQEKYGYLFLFSSDSWFALWLSNVFLIFSVKCHSSSFCWMIWVPTVTQALLVVDWRTPGYIILSCFPAKSFITCFILSHLYISSFLLPHLFFICLCCGPSLSTIPYHHFLVTLILSFRCQFLVHVYAQCPFEL